jgi:hypothetical protein
MQGGMPMSGLSQVFTNPARDLRSDYTNPANAPGNPEEPIRQSKVRLAAALDKIKRKKRPGQQNGMSGG